jgi:hypothetical protein
MLRNSTGARSTVPEKTIPRIGSNWNDSGPFFAGIFALTGSISAE